MALFTWLVSLLYRAAKEWFLLSHLGYKSEYHYLDPFQLKCINTFLLIVNVLGSRLQASSYRRPHVDVASRAITITDDVIARTYCSRQHVYCFPDRGEQVIM